MVGIAAALGCLTSTILGNGELGARLVTTAQQSDESADGGGIGEDIQFLLEVEAELHGGGPQALRSEHHLLVTFVCEYCECTAV